MENEDEKSEILRESIRAAKPFAPKSARGVAEMVTGRPLSDEEWSQHGPPWEAQWNLRETFWCAVVKAVMMPIRRPYTWYFGYSVGW